MRILPLLLALLLSGGPSGLAQDRPSPDSLTDPVSRRPVLLVPGWLGRAEDMVPLQQRLVRDGWREEEVVRLEFQDPVGSSKDHAEELEDAIRRILDEGGGKKVDIVAHSMGGLAVWALLQEKGEELPISRVVFLATPFHGTLTAYLAWGDGGPEMIPESDFLQELQGAGWPQRWVSALAIRTPLDLTVFPSEGATLLGAAEKVICCPTHQGLLDHEETYVAIRQFLLHGTYGEPPTP